MIPDLMSTAYSYGGMQQAQGQSPIQVQVFKNAMDAQTQSAQELLQGFTASNAAINPPHLGNNLDITM